MNPSISFVVVSNSQNLYLLKNCIESISRKVSIDYEIIVIIQKSVNLEVEFLRMAKNLAVYYIDNTSLSASRKLGVGYCSKSYVHFIDDDAELLMCPSPFISNYNSYDFIAGRVVSHDNGFRSYSRRQKVLTKELFKNNLDMVLSSALIIKNSALLKDIIDDDFGVGSIYGSSEETDLCLTMLSRNLSGIYIGYYCVSHPSKLLHSFDIISLKKKFYSYGYGRGALLAKHKGYLSIFFIFWYFLQRFFLTVGSLFFLRSLHKNLNFYRGLCHGYLDYEA